MNVGASLQLKDFLSFREEVSTFGQGDTQCVGLGPVQRIVIEIINHIRSIENSNGIPGFPTPDSFFFIVEIFKYKLGERFRLFGAGGGELEVFAGLRSKDAGVVGGCLGELVRTVSRVNQCIPASPDRYESITLPDLGHGLYY